MAGDRASNPVIPVGIRDSGPRELGQAQAASAITQISKDASTLLQQQHEIRQSHPIIRNATSQHAIATFGL
jgi:hypothetical protein